jgi:uncharacterized protein (TIGR02001 family)
MQKFTLLIVALVLFVISTLPAVAAIEVEGDAYLSYNSMYLWRGADLSSGDAVMQGGMDLSFKGLTLSYWSNYSLENSTLDETDIVLDYTFAAGELVNISLGHILYSVQGYDDTSEVYAGVSLNSILEPALTVYYDYDEAAGDIFVTASVGHSIELSNDLSLSLGALASYKDSDSYSELHNAEFSAGLDYAVTEQIALSPAVIFSTPLSDEAEADIEDEFMAGLTLTLSF